MKTKTKKPAKTKVFMLELDTRHFSFRCFAETKEECYDHFWKAWKKHCGQPDFRVEDSLFPTRRSLTNGEYADSLELTEISLPLFLRDGQEICVDGN